jgi:hypothetical protein
MKTRLKLSFIVVITLVLASCAQRKHSCAAYNEVPVAQQPAH